MKTAKLVVNKEMDSLVIEVWSGNQIIYAHDYMQHGCTDAQYHALIDQAITDLNADLSDVESWEGCDMFEGSISYLSGMRHSVIAAFTTEDNEVVVCPVDYFVSHTHRDLVLHFFPELKN